MWSSSLIRSPLLRPLASTTASRLTLSTSSTLPRRLPLLQQFSSLGSRPLLQDAADASPLSSNATGTSNRTGSRPPPPPPGGRGGSDRGGGDRDGDSWSWSTQSGDPTTRYMRNTYVMTWVLLVAVLFDWWNSSVAAGGALLTAHELKNFFQELLAALQKENSLLRSELANLTEAERRSRDEIRQEIATVRKEVIAVLLHGRSFIDGDSFRDWGSGAASAAEEATQRLFRRGVDNDSVSSWLSSLAEKTGMKGRRGDDGRGDKGERQSIYDQGFFAGLQHQLNQALQPGQGGGRGEGGSYPTNPSGNGGSGSGADGSKGYNKQPLPLSTDEKPQQQR